jgi:hypothetical protein
LVALLEPIRLRGGDTGGVEPRIGVEKHGGPPGRRGNGHRLVLQACELEAYIPQFS